MVKILSIFEALLENMNFKDKILPHVEELELHHNTLSSCSQKVRACLGETGLKHRKIHHILPSSGGWETKTADYLNNVNPAGTVPVLVHNGEKKFLLRTSKEICIFLVSKPSTCIVIQSSVHN